MQTRWLGRENARDTEAYRHATMDERIQWVKNGIRDGQISGTLANVYFQLPEEERDIFLEGQVQAVHFTALGLCLHDYSITCPFHLNCTRRCRDYLRRKGNQDKRRNLIQIQKQTKKALVLAQEQLATENAAIADPGSVTTRKRWKGVEAALAIDDDPLTPESALVQPFEGLPSQFQPLSLSE